MIVDGPVLPSNALPTNPHMPVMKTIMKRSRLLGGLSRIKQDLLLYKIEVERVTSAVFLLARGFLAVAAPS
jgi:hypothetical protein